MNQSINTLRRNSNSAASKFSAAVFAFFGLASSQDRTEDELFQNAERCAEAADTYQRALENLRDGLSGAAPVNIREGELQRTNKLMQLLAVERDTISRLQHLMGSKDKTYQTKSPTTELGESAAQTGLETTESARRVAEHEREAAETGRVAAETRREIAAIAQVEAERQRVVAEEIRAVAEDERVITEEERRGAEELRLAAEELRKVAEESRASAEDARVAAAETREVANEARQFLGAVLEQMATKKTGD